MHHEKERRSCLGFYTTLVEFYIEEALWGFIPCGFLEENIVFLCYYACCSFSDPTRKKCFKISSKKLRKLNNDEDSAEIWKPAGLEN